MLNSALVNPNATVTISLVTTTVDAAGGTVLGVGTTVENNVPVLVSLVQGKRDGRFDTDWDVTEGTFSGESSNLARQDVVITFLTGLNGVKVGSVARLLNVTGHPASPDGWLPARYQGRWEIVATGEG